MKAKSKRKSGRTSKVKATARARRKTRTSARSKSSSSRATSKASARAKTKTSVRAKAKGSAKSRSPAKVRPKRSAKTRTAAKARTGKPGHGRWVQLVEKHGIVLAAAKGPVPNVAEAVAGEPIVGSWWAHQKGKAIFAALSEIDDSPDVRCFKLIDGKVTFAHRKTWPALVRLGHDGVLAPEQLAAVAQEHMPSGEHRNVVTPFPDWVDEATAAAAAKLTTEAARAQLAWLDASVGTTSTRSA